MSRPIAAHGCYAVGFLLFLSVVIVNYSNLFLLEWTGILQIRSCNKRNSHPVLALGLSCSFHTRKNIGKRPSALFLLFCVHSRGKLLLIAVLCSLSCMLML